MIAFWQAARSAWHATDPFAQCIGVLLAGVGIPRRAALCRLPTRPLAHFRRLFSWLASPVINRPGGDAEAELIERAAECYASADAAARGHIRLELLGHVENPASDACVYALRLAARLPLPEARPRIIRLLADYCMPDDETVGGTRPWPRRELIPPAVDALSRFNCAEDARIFRFLVSRLCGPAMRDEADWHIAERVAVALCKADPTAFERDLPIYLRSAPEVRAALDKPVGA